MKNILIVIVMLLILTALSSCSQEKNYITEKDFLEVAEQTKEAVVKLEELEEELENLEKEVQDLTNENNALKAKIEQSNTFRDILILQRKVRILEERMLSGK